MRKVCYLVEEEKNLSDLLGCSRDEVETLEVGLAAFVSLLREVCSTSSEA